MAFGGWFLRGFPEKGGFEEGLCASGELHNPLGVGAIGVMKVGDRQTGSNPRLTQVDESVRMPVGTRETQDVSGLDQT